MQTRDQSEDRQVRFIVVAQETPSGLAFGVNTRSGAVVLPPAFRATAAVNSAIIFEKTAAANAQRKAAMLSA